MRRGLMDDEFFLVYQPQIDMGTGRACGVEALLRWRDPERGVIGPNEFIPIAEESGMIQALGARVLRDACRQVMVWHRHNMLLRLAVNLSVQQLQHDSWLSIVDDALKSSGHAGALPRPGDHRKRHHHAPRQSGRDADPTQSDGRIDHGRRLRHRAIRACRTSRGCRSRASRSTSASSTVWRRIAATRRSRRRSSRYRTAWACGSSPKAWRRSRSTNSSSSHGCEEAQGYLISRPLEEPALRAWWKMQDEENRIVGRQTDMWRQGTDD